VSAERGVLYDDEENLEITVSATYVGPIDEVDYTVHVVRPDGSPWVPIVMEPDTEEGGMARGFFPAAEFHGRGTVSVHTLKRRSRQFSRSKRRDVRRGRGRGRGRERGRTWS
jgi:hypothetical protein